MMEGYRNPHVKHLLCNLTAQRVVCLGGCHFCASFVVLEGFVLFCGFFKPLMKWHFLKPTLFLKTYGG